MTSSWLLWRDVFLRGRTEAQLARQVIPLPAALFDEGWSLRAQGSYYVVCLVALGAVLVAVALLQRSRLGRSMIAVRDNERAAASFGISPAVVKITAFGIGGWIAGLAGGLFVGLVTRVQPGDFPAAESLRVISIVVIGGLSSVTGAVLGAFWVVGLPKLFGDSVEIGLLTSGAGLLILLLYFPGGLAQVLYSVRDNAFAFLARRLARARARAGRAAAAARARQRVAARDPGVARRGDPGRATQRFVRPAGRGRPRRPPRCAG